MKKKRPTMFSLSPGVTATLHEETRIWRDLASGGRLTIQMPRPPMTDAQREEAAGHLRDLALMLEAAVGKGP